MLNRNIINLDNINTPEGSFVRIVEPSFAQYLDIPSNAAINRVGMRVVTTGFSTAVGAVNMVLGHGMITEGLVCGCLGCFCVCAGYVCANVGMAERQNARGNNPQVQTITRQ